MKRRKVLGGLGLIGGSAAIGGFTTQALFGDSEGTSATFTAGELDLQIDWQSTHNGTVINEGGPTDVDGKLVGAFKDVKPCDTGCIELSVHNDTNPAYVWTAFEITADHDNNLNEPEMEAEDGNFSTASENGSSDDGCFFGGKLEEWNGTQFGVIENGQQTDADNEYVLMVDTDEKTQDVRVKLHVEETKGDENELTKYRLESLTEGCGICAVDTKSGGGPAGSDDDTVEATTDFDGCVTGKTPVVTTPSTNDQGILQGISYIEVFVCNTDGDPGAPETDDDGELDECITGRFFEDPNQDCEPQDGEKVFFGAPASDPVEAGDDLRTLIDGNVTRDAGGINLGVIGTRTTDDDPSVNWYSLEWKLPCDCGNEIQSDSFRLNVYFYAMQARNNDSPTSPWTS